MKTILLAIILCWMTPGLSQGNSCSNANTLPIDGVYRSFPVSTAAGPCIFCTMAGYNGNNGKITYFKFTTDNLPQCVLIDVNASTSITMELVLYDACNTGVPSPVDGLYKHNMCMNQGSGLWAQNLFDNLAGNTTYFLKVRTEGGYTGDLSVSAKYYTPPNQNCLGATPISSSATVADNNACHRPGTVTPSELCAITLENTAWYTYVVQATGSSTITIDNILCNNGNGNSNNGFQIGFFSGDCNNLIPLTCSSGAGGTVQATATGLTGGTRIYVAIDGYSGSNCSYTIQASNSSPLPVRLKQFGVTKETGGNLLKWVTVQEDRNAFFEIQRSIDGRTFYGLDRIPGEFSSSTEKEYRYLDDGPPWRCFYRLKQVDLDGYFTFSNVLEVTRTGPGTDPLVYLSADNNNLRFNLRTVNSQQVRLNIFSTVGRLVYSGWINVNKGLNTYQQDIRTLTNGLYILELSIDNQRISRKFMKG